MKVKLTEKFIRDINGLDQRQYFGDTEIRGLTLVVSKQSSKASKQGKEYLTKSFYINYRSVSHGPTKEYIGQYGTITLSEARRKAKKIAAQVVEKKDRYSLRKEIGQGYTLRSLIELFIDKRLKEPNYKKKTISAIKSSFDTWVFKKSINPAFKKFYDYEDYADKPLHLITRSLMQDVHVAVSVKTPTQANRLIAYLKVVFNFAIDRSFIKNNPCEGVKMNKESEAMKVLNSDQINAVVNAAFVKDGRTGKLNFRYYYERGYGVVACMVLVWALRTGRRLISEGCSIKWENINWKSKKIFLEDSKVGPMNYSLDKNTIDILETIRKSNYKDISMLDHEGHQFKSNKYNGPFCYSDIRKEYIFPSNSFGKKTPSGKIGKTPHITEVDATWVKILEDLNIPYLPPKQLRHSFATDFYRKTRNLKALQRQLGHSNLKTTAKYLKMVELDYEDSLEEYSNKTAKPSNADNVKELKLFRD